MLHPVPDSTERARLLAVVEMQRQLIEGLCALRDESRLSIEWLQSIWPGAPADWVRKFWENDTGKRAKWCATIASGTLDEKQTILALVAEQLRFRELYDSPATLRLTKHKWTTPVMEAANDLLKAFYAPLFYKSDGFPAPGGATFDKDEFIAGFTPRPNVCPYSDGLIQSTKLDHFLPKDHFPALSCHPDNLIPCSTDPNSVELKGTKIPLEMQQPDQAADWFHPRWRSADNAIRVTFPDSAAPVPVLELHAVAPENQTRVTKMAAMFGLLAFWGRDLAAEVQLVASDVNGLLNFDNQAPTEASVRARVTLLAQQKRGKIGREALAIVKSHFYAHIASTPSLLRQVVDTCQSDFQLRAAAAAPAP